MSAELKAGDFPQLVPEETELLVRVRFHGFENVAGNGLKQAKFCSSEAVRGLADQLATLYHDAHAFSGCWFAVGAEQISPGWARRGRNLGGGPRIDERPKREEEDEDASARVNDGFTERAGFVNQWSIFRCGSGKHDSREQEIAVRESMIGDRR